MNKNILKYTLVITITVFLTFIAGNVNAASVDLSADMPPVRSQGSYGSCVGWATGYYYKTFVEKQEHGWSVDTTDHQFSPTFIWNQANGGDSSQGMSIGGSFNMLKETGTPTYELMGNVDYRTWPNQAQWQNAMYYRSESNDIIYHEAFMTDINNLKQRLDAGGVLVAGVPSYDDQLSATGGNDVHAYPEGSLRGGHAVTIVGYDDDRSYTDSEGNPQTGAFKFVNSWGSSWSGDGYSWLSYDFVENYMIEAWVDTDKIGYVPQVWANIDITHPVKNQIRYGLGVGNSSDPTWQSLKYNMAGADNANISASHDLTDQLDYMPPNDTDNNWYFYSEDLISDGNSGTLDGFEINYQDNIFTDNDTPVNIPEDGSTMYTSIDIGDGGENSPPTQPTSVVITPELPNTTDDLYCEASGSNDPDGGLVTYLYNWYKNDVLQPELAGPVLNKDNTSKDDLWRCEATPTDGILNGPSDQVDTTILNSAPVLTAVGDKSIEEEALLEFSLNASDDDIEDLLTFSSSGLPDGANLNSETGLFSWTPTNEQSGDYSINFIVSDGDDTDDETIIITVTDVPEEEPEDDDPPQNELTPEELTCQKADKLLNYNDKIRPKGGGTVAVYRSNKFGCRNYPVLSPKVFRMRGYRWRDIKEVDPDLFRDIPNRRILVHKNGSLISATNSGTIWVIEKQYRHYIKTREQLRKIRRQLPKSQRKVIDVKPKKLKRIRYGGETTLAEIIRDQYQLARY